MLSHLKIRRNATECILPWIELFLFAFCRFTLFCVVQISRELVCFISSSELSCEVGSFQLNWKVGKELSWRTQKSGRTNRVEKEFEVFTGAVGKC